MVAIQQIHGCGILIREPDAEFEGGKSGALKQVVITDRKSTRLNSSHSQISYAVFCLKKKRSSKDSSASACERGRIDRRPVPRSSPPPSRPETGRTLRHRSSPRCPGCAPCPTAEAAR